MPRPVPVFLSIRVPARGLSIESPGANRPFERPRPMADSVTALSASSGTALAVASGYAALGAAAGLGAAGLGGLSGATARGGGPVKAIGGVVLRLGDGRGAAPAAEEPKRDPAAAARETAAEDKTRRDEEPAEAKDRVQSLRTRLDPETLRIFTEVIDPITREALYRVPPTAISETAEREGEFLARYERMVSSLSLAPQPKPAAALTA
jgi:hypothetical protein